MVCFTDYELLIPKTNLDDFVEYVLKKIYEFDNDDLWFLYENIQQPKYNTIKVVEETDNFIKITFKRSNFIAVRNVLPITIIDDNKNFKNDIPIELYDECVHRIWGKRRSARDDLARIYGEYHIENDADITNLILALANEKVIDKYHYLYNNMFICVSGGVPIYIGYHDNKLIVDIAYTLVFDYDDGFFGQGTEIIQEKFQQWKEKGDIKEEIFSPNDLRQS